VYKFLALGRLAPSFMASGDAGLSISDHLSSFKSEADRVWERVSNVGRSWKLGFLNNKINNCAVLIIKNLTRH